MNRFDSTRLERIDYYYSRSRCNRWRNLERQKEGEGEVNGSERYKRSRRGNESGRRVVRWMIIDETRAVNFPPVWERRIWTPNLRSDKSRLIDATVNGWRCAYNPPDTNILPAGIRLNVTAACSSIRSPPPPPPSLPPRIVRYNDKRDNLNLPLSLPPQRFVITVLIVEDDWLWEIGSRNDIRRG